MPRQIALGPTSHRVVAARPAAVRAQHLLCSTRAHDRAPCPRVLSDAMCYPLRNPPSRPASDPKEWSSDPSTAAAVYAATESGWVFHPLFGFFLAGRVYSSAVEHQLRDSHKQTFARTTS